MNLLIIGFFATCIVSLHAAPMITTLKNAKRSVLVDDRGFYLGEGSNNNLREAAQLHDLGGPIVNPWINAYTQPVQRFGNFGAVGPVGPGGPIGPPAAPVIAPPMGAPMGGYAQQGYQQQQTQFAPPQQSFMPQQQTQFAPPQQPFMPQQQTEFAPPQQPFMPQQQTQFAPPQQSFMPQQQTQFVAPPPHQPATSFPMGMPADDSSSIQPFTAVFVSGKPTMFRIGVPTEFPNGYTSM